jgi:putative spermidine/putrescine transport system permease protein
MTEPADVMLRGVTKMFGPVAAVSDLTLEIPRGIFLSLLGPSGCGKTTTLRLIAGFEHPSQGDIFIRGERVNLVPAYRRDFSMVFQNFALVPHMRVASNVAFGLRMRGLPREEKESLVREALALVHLAGFEHRYPKQLSGGQQQWVALAASILATALGTLGSLFLARRRGTAAGLLNGLFLSPLVFPTIIVGVALLLFFRRIGMPILPGLILAHVLIGTPYCIRSILTSLQGFDVALEEAGQSLGASPVRTFFLITLPLIRPGILCGWLFAFIVSFGELNMALFLTGPGVTTLPIEIFAYLQFQGSQLVIAAASTLQICLIIVLVTAIERLVGLSSIVR